MMLEDVATKLSIIKIRSMLGFIFQHHGSHLGCCGGELGWVVYVFFCGFLGGSKGVTVDEHYIFICLLFCLIKILIHRWLVIVVVTVLSNARSSKLSWDTPGA